MPVNEIPDVSVMSNSPVCRGETLLLSTDFIPGATYEWGGPNGFNSSIFNPAPDSESEELVSGTYWVIVDNEGCISDTVSLEVTIEELPAVPDVLNDGPVCVSDPNASLLLSIDPGTAVQGATYTWYDGNFDPISGESTDLDFQLTNFEDYSTDGTYAFYVRSRLNDCFSPFSDPTEVLISTIPNIQAFAGNDTSVCVDQAFFLNAEPPAVGTGLWTLVLGDPTGVVIANPNEANTSVNGLIAGLTYRFRWTLSNGACEDFSSDDIEVLVSEAELPNAGVNRLACASDTIFLNANAPIDTNSVGFWTQPMAQDSFGVIIVDEFDPNTLVTGLEPDNLYTFTWNITSGCGELSDEVFVTISDPDPQAGDDYIECNDTGETQLMAFEPTFGSNGVWSTPDEDIVIEQPDREDSEVFNLMPGENIFVWTIDEGICGDFSRDTLRVFYKMNPRADPDEVAVEFQKEAEVDVLENDFTPPNSIATILSGPSEGTIEVLGNGLYRYQAPFNFVGTDEMTYELCSEGCECSITTVTFVVGEGVDCKVPSIITPNNDGINDDFVIPCLLDGSAFPQSQVKIFNRWGDEVYRSPSPYLNDWKGTFNGEDLPAGTYFYIIDFGNGEQQNGYLILQR